jgi:hypothetical protein
MYISINVVPFTFSWFLELKHKDAKGSLSSAENCGQMLDNFLTASSNQPSRDEFVAVLSNLEDTLVFEATFKNGTLLQIIQRTAVSFVDAIIYADAKSCGHVNSTLPTLDERLVPKDMPHNLLMLSKEHYIFSVPFPSPDDVPSGSWMLPSRFDGGPLVLKVSRRRNIENEKRILRRLKTIQDSMQSVHIPELVWGPDEVDNQIGIVPLGQPVQPDQSMLQAHRLIVNVIDGLEFLHSQQIIHRDIRQSNLVWHPRKEEIIIIDYESSYHDTSHKGTTYEGGMICWPRRLLESKQALYEPKPSDDLEAVILLVITMLFPLRFERFDHRLVGVNGSEEAEKLLQLWVALEQSSVWGSLVTAAHKLNYVKLKGLTDVFCFV